MHKQMMTLCTIATLCCGATFAEEPSQADVKKITTADESAPLAGCPCTGKKKKTTQFLACPVCGDPHHKRRRIELTIEATDEKQAEEAAISPATEQAVACTVCKEHNKKKTA